MVRIGLLLPSSLPGNKFPPTLAFFDLPGKAKLRTILQILKNLITELLNAFQHETINSANNDKRIDNKDNCSQ